MSTSIWMAIMPRVSPTRTYVAQFARELLADGVSPTQARIRELIAAQYGVKASPNVVGAELQAFWQEVGPQMAAFTQLGKGGIGQSVPGSAPSSAPAVFGEVETARYENLGLHETLNISGTGAAPSDEGGAEQARFQYEIFDLQDAVRAASSRAEHFEALCSEKDALVAEAVRRGTDMASRLGILEQRAQTFEKEMAEARAKLEREVKAAQLAAREKVEQLQAQLTERERAVAEAAKQLDGSRRHMMLETDRIRTAAANDARRLKDELEVSRMREQRFMIQKNDAIDELSRVRDELEAAHARIRTLEQAAARAGVAEKPLEAQSVSSPAATPERVSYVPPATSHSYDPDGQYE
ncbi:hypothetical protein F6X40_10595 [Paraburkholderia sp. UCT31]|uniref:DNA-binding protein n=1 Tax=Paraburkholderia sp. UCT31 TaxID=2615209 RepID=UPI0016556937|nr:DNA-binding protein [Paraburkholderia sp. UCT31]MBC8737256.1 hypothetical protein [Paraburkholderia sp. UCT31]